MVMEAGVLLGILALGVWFAGRMIKAYQADEVPETDKSLTEKPAVEKTTATGKTLSKTQQKAKKRERAARMQKSDVAKKAQAEKFLKYCTAERGVSAAKPAAVCWVTQAQQRLGMRSAATLGQAALGAAVAYAWLAPRGAEAAQVGGVLGAGENFCEDEHYEHECDCDPGGHDYDGGDYGGGGADFGGYADGGDFRGGFGGE